MGFGNLFKTTVPNTSLSILMNRVNRYIIACRYVPLTSIVCGRLLRILEDTLADAKKIDEGIDVALFKSSISSMIEALNPSDWAHNDAYHYKYFTDRCHQMKRYIDSIDNNVKLTNALYVIDAVAYVFAQEETDLYNSMVKYTKEKIREFSVPEENIFVRNAKQSCKTQNKR